MQIESVRNRRKVKIEEAINRTTRGNKEQNTRDRREATTWEFLTNPALPLIVIFVVALHVLFDTTQAPSIAFPL